MPDTMPTADNQLELLELQEDCSLSVDMSMPLDDLVDDDPYESEPHDDPEEATFAADIRSGLQKHIAPNNIELDAQNRIFDVDEDTEPGIYWVDPRAITIHPINPRFELPFDPQAQHELVTSMSLHRNLVPVRLRRNPYGMEGFEVVSGAQRLGAAIVLQREKPSFRIRATIAESMSDEQAFLLSEADNAGRTDILPMRAARTWQKALLEIYSGDRGKLIRACGKSPAVVSRTLAMLEIPQYVLDCCLDPELLSVNFAGQLMPKISDPAIEPDIRRRADALHAQGAKLKGPQLLHALLTDRDPTTAIGQLIWSAQDGAKTMVYKAPTKGIGGQFDLKSELAFSAAERKDLLSKFGEFLKQINNVT